jgi:hypothetical protein
MGPLLALSQSGATKLTSLRARTDRPGQGRHFSICPRASDRAPLERRQSATRPPAEMKCKTDKIRAAWAAGDRIGALRIAARSFDRQCDLACIERRPNSDHRLSPCRQVEMRDFAADHWPTAGAELSVTTSPTRGTCLPECGVKHAEPTAKETGTSFQ